ncbi:hypothetical protein KXD40_000580 [Peronospora effusa]|uniref:WRKY19-like zinc finger domain-containing protein n=1 Tax=Peronospora effusa TaxID=542832 RepID=A0A3M6VBQ3_9STRA|nr:hypothetical protein DD238_005120 [Peronospora effusa]RQM13302.1 hypothetical protein DD237_005491 [Peronospora effusa]UIZ21723.1 hypothetical protein KXD40_000580 [Peronospora effusa]CAI5723193.1 unnamed protein product [Peronospora effusa]
MFFANGFVETDRRASPIEENDILRELLLDNDFVSPRQLQPTTGKMFEDYIESSNSASTTWTSKRNNQQVDVSFPQICFDNSLHFTRLQPLSTRSCAILSLPNQSPMSASAVNAIVSPPRVFGHDFARLSQPFFYDNVSVDSDMRGMKSEKSTVSFLTSCLPPTPLPMLSMPPFKKNKLSVATVASSSERKQLRCTHPDCPNLRRSAGFCNRHSGKVCSMSGCNKSALSRGKCPEHGGGSRCKKDGCSKFAQTRGLCKSHGGGRQCNVTGCIKNAHQNRLCRSHGGGKRCDYFNCPKWAQRSGYCCAHTKMSSSGTSTSSGDSQHSHSNTPAAIVTSSPASSLSMFSAPVPSPTLLSPHRLFSLLP